MAQAHGPQTRHSVQVGAGTEGKQGNDVMTDEQRQARIHHHMYDTCEGIAEHAERIVALEELVYDSLTTLLGITMAVNEHVGRDVLDATTPPARAFAGLQARARDLGIPNA